MKGLESVRTLSGNMWFWRKTFARVTMACWTRSCELLGPPGQGSLRIRFASASYCANASSRRLRAAEASGDGRSSWLYAVTNSGQYGARQGGYRTATNVMLMTSSWNCGSASSISFSSATSASYSRVKRGIRRTSWVY